jgi:predicted nucleic-acid-binding protein
MTILDTNAILRYILYDIPEQAEITADTILNEKILLLPEIIAETVHILFTLYKIPRMEIMGAILDVLDDTECDNEIIREGLWMFGLNKCDFIDSLLYIYSKSYKILTFDEKLSNGLRALERQRDYASFNKKMDFSKAWREGRAEGRADVRIDAAKKLLEMGVGIDVIAEVTGLSRVEIESLREAILVK